MKLKFKILLVSVATVAAAILASCAKNNLNHAPVCPYGQALTYTSGGYSCDFVSMTPSSYNTLAVQNTQPPVPGGMVTPPVQSCNGDPNETLVNWMGAWICYFSQEIYPSNGNSPQSLTPPAQMNGEFCTSAGISSAYISSATPYGGVNPLGNTMVQCSPGFQCVATGAPNTSSTYSGYGSYGFGLGYGGTAGACKYYGY